MLPRHKHLGAAEFCILKGGGKHPQTGEFKTGDYVYERNGAVHDELAVDEEIILYMTSYGSSAFLNPDDTVQFWLDAQSLRAMTGGGEAASH